MKKPLHYTKGVTKTAHVLIIPFLSSFGSVEGIGLSPFARDCSTMDLRDEISFFFKTLKHDPRDKDPSLGAASESVDGEYGDDNGDGKVSENSFSSDLVIDDHVASVIMMDEGMHDDVSTMDNVACGNKEISIDRLRSPSSSTQNEEIVTNDV